MCEDLKLHFIEFGGMLLCELILVFGAIFSTGIYDDLAKEVLGCAIFLSDMDEDLVQQHLDDETAGDGLIFTFNEAYRYVWQLVGVRLAPRDDPDKSFAPNTEGLVLGVWYGTINWTWRIREDKLAGIVQQLSMITKGGRKSLFPTCLVLLGSW